MTPPASKHVEVAVRDSGRGIAPDVLPTVFDMFMQVDCTSGLGLGLPVVKRLVELHGGTVVGRREGLGRGCEFAVRLPIAPKESGYA